MSLRGRSGHLSRAILGGSETAGSENGDMLENDDPYGTFAMFSRSRGLRNGPEMLPEAYFSDVRVQTSAEGVSGSVVGASRELQDGFWDGRMATPQTTVDQSRLVTRYGRGGYCLQIAYV